MMGGAGGRRRLCPEAAAFLEGLRRRARHASRRIGFPEAGEERTRQALRWLAEERLVRPVAVGSAADLAPLREEVPGLEIAEPGEAPPLPPRGEGGEDPEPGSDPLLAAAALLAAGRLDGVVAGAARPTPDVIRAGLRAVGVAEGFATVSSSFYLALREPTPGGEAVLTFTDAGVVPQPGAEQLAEIAAAAARARRLVVGDEARVAFLSYSTHGSAGGEPVERIRHAVGLFRQRCPEVEADGELQADAALVPEVARRKAPGGALGGRANVLVFPDLNAANIAYKLVQRLAGAMALGPVLQGLARPLNDLSRGASPEEILYVACITALMGGSGEEREGRATTGSLGGSRRGSGGPARRGAR